MTHRTPDATASPIIEYPGFIMGGADSIGTSEFVFPDGPIISSPVRYRNISMKPLSSEVEISGSWIFENGRMMGDESCKRISWLTTNYLRKIANADGGWETLFQDPNDGRFWERTFPQSALHGGGPPKLTLLMEKDVRTKYGL